ncbi:YbaB/EbfC family nucleoid-associated protein [Plantactinospora sp. KLBMP9567]|uniref:YbaB/EbfC family nucleoid-associated protein n=1 Tax=Plantactinospora sp. KLBMP9567 TaxID=3085900 RepID=UPI002981F6CE|nr:YbaB/EbfC family nucleoid-associated protein [Plantactinospora sp. KLBMP9567]MDW5330253.1 YbaB/EbfC family nucleoid-associated protein [Plantactinospora sp. KLBMP9567]
MSGEPERDPVADSVLATLDRVSGHGRSEDGLERAAIDGGGIPRELSIDGEAMRQAPAALSASILEALRHAHEDLRVQVGQELARAADAGDPTGAPSAAADAARVADDLDRMAQDMSGEFDTMRRRLFDACHPSGRSRCRRDAGRLGRAGCTGWRRRTTRR